LNKYLFFAVGVAAMLGAGAASAQGLPFSSQASTSQPWGVNRAQLRDMNVFHARAAQQQPNEAAAVRTTARN
jgi:hypothetical protein